MTEGALTIKKCRRHILLNMKYLLFTGGGSAGHVVPNLAVMQELRSAFRLAYMGTGGIERTLAGEFGCPYFTVDCPKLIRGFTLRNVAVPLRLRRAVCLAKDILSKERPDLVFSKGGYASFPAVWAAYTLHIPVLTHESDLTPGLCTRLIAKKCRHVLTTFPETANRFSNGRWVGSPVRRELRCAVRASARKKYGFNAFGDRPVLLVLGGGSGSRAINEALRAHLPALLLRFDILHLCGRGNAIEYKNDGYVQREFERDMGSAYACADLVLARAGSNTVCELIALKKPALLVPLCRGTRGDQVQNARYCAARGLCACLAEKNLKELPSALLRLYANAEIRAALAHAPPVDGTQNIVNAICEALS